MSLGDFDEDSLGAYIKEKNINSNMSMVIDEDEIEADKKEEEEIYQRYEKIGNLTNIESIKESKLIKNYDNQGNKYYNEYKFIKILGKGSYSKVKLVKKDNINYAMKIIDKKILKNKKIFKQDKDGNIIVTNLLKDALKEIAILKKLDHPNIIKLYEILHNHQKQKIYLILEYAEYGDIINYDEEKEIFNINSHVEEMYNQRDLGYNMGQSIGNKKYYEEKDIRHFIKHILLGLDYLHKNGIIHHDIKPNNILLCKKKICKITDFNFSSILENLDEDNIGSNGESADNFKAPETIHLNDDSINEDKEYQGKPLDIWAFGVTLYIITYLKFPFDTDKNVLELYRIIKEEKVNFPIEPWYSPKIKYLIKKCLEKDPQKRYTTDEILKILMVHKRENLDKYKSVFMKRMYSVDLPNNELVLSLDFIANECSAVFENPKDKNKPIVIKIEKKYKDYNIPEDRMSKEVYDKFISKPLPKSQKQKNVFRQIEKQYLKYEEKENEEENKINPIPKNIPIKKEEKKDNKKGINFLSTMSEKVNEMLVKDKDKSEEIHTTIQTTTIISKEIVIDENNIVGKAALKKYINDN